MTAPREVSAAERAARDAAAAIAYSEQNLPFRWRHWAFEYLRALDTCPTCGGTGRRQPPPRPVAAVPVHQQED